MKKSIYIFLKLFLLSTIFTSFVLCNNVIAEEINTSQADRDYSYVDIDKKTINSDGQDNAEFTVYLRNSQNQSVASEWVYVASKRGNIDKIEKSGDYEERVIDENIKAFKSKENGILKFKVSSLIAGFTKISVGLNDKVYDFLINDNVTGEDAQIIDTKAITYLLKATFTIGSNIIELSDGTKIVSDVAPFYHEGKAVIPYSVLGEVFGLNVNTVFAADGSVSAITYSQGNNELTMFIGSKVYVYNGIANNLETAPFIQDDNTFVPIDIIQETFGYQIEIIKINKSSVISVSIDNDPNARPQSGLVKADIVFETAIAPGATRFLAVYDLSKLNADVTIGPVRSARKHFVELAAGFGGGFAHAGGSTDSLDLIPQTSLVNFDEIYGSENYFYRIEERNMPHNLYTSSERLKQGILDKGFDLKSIEDIFERGNISGGNKAEIIAVHYNGQENDTVFKWDDEKLNYARFENGEVNTTVFADNLVVAYTEHDEVYVQDLDEKKIIPQVIGSGKAKFYRDGKVWEGQWSKTSIASNIDFRYNNIPMILKEGNVWILFVDNSTFKSSNNNLKTLELSSGSLNPSFDKEITEYKVTIANSESKINITAEVEDVKSTMVLDGNTLNNKEAKEVLVNVGENPINIIVTAENGETKTYKIIVTRNGRSGTSAGGGGGGGGAPPKKQEQKPENPIAKRTVEKTADDKALKSSLEKTGKAEISLEDRSVPKASFSAENIRTLNNNKASLKIENKGLQVEFPSQTLAIEELTRNKENASLELGARQVSLIEKNQIISKTSLGESTGLFEIGGTIVDLTAEIKHTSNGVTTTEKIKNFNEPVAVTIDLSNLNLTEEDIANLTGIRYEKDARGNIKPVKLGGKYNPDTKTFTFYTDRFSIYGVLKASDLVKIRLGINMLNVSVNDQYKLIDAPPVIINNRTMVPLRFIAENLGANIKWITETRTVNIKLDEKEIDLIIDKAIDGVDIPATIINGRTFVPIRYVSEKFGATVTWFPNSRNIEIVK